VAVFLGIMAYVAAGRAAQREGRQEQAPVRSALALAKSITGDLVTQLPALATRIHVVVLKAPATS